MYVSMYVSIYVYMYVCTVYSDIVYTLFTMEYTILL